MEEENKKEREENFNDDPEQSLRIDVNTRQTDPRAPD